MPNYNLVVNSTFKPFTLQEYLTPLMMYSQAYKEQADALEELDTKSSIWEGLIDKNIDPEIYAQYKNYSDSLAALSDELSSSGLSVNTRSALRKLKSRYAKDITPIEQAYNARLEDIKAQREDARRTNGNTIYTQDASTISLSKYMNGKRPDYSQTNVDDIYKETAAGVASISAQMFSDPEIKALSDQYNLYTQVQGMTSERALATMKDKNSAFRKLSDAMKERYGYDSYDERGRRKMDAAINQGIITGATMKRIDNPLQNMNFQSDAQREAVNFQKQQYYNGLAMQGRVYDKETGKWKYVKADDLDLQRGEAYKDAGISPDNTKGNKVPRPIVDKNKVKEVHKGTSGYVFKPSGENNTLTEQSNGIYTYGEEQIKDKVSESIRKRIIKVVGKDKWNSPNFRLFFNKETKNYVLLEDAHTYTAEAWNNEQQTGNAAGDKY